MLWYVKSRRAQSEEDYETWVEGGVMPTLNAFDNGDVRTTAIVFHAHRSDGVRLQGDTVNTLTAFMGTGGNNMPMVAIPIHDKATRFNSKRKLHTGEYVSDGAGNGLGVGKEGDPMNTLTSGDRHAVVYPIQSTVINRSDTAGPQGKGYGDENSPMFTQTMTDVHAIADTTIVRRLTPIECERLQGFPDNWTDGQADSHRYKQMGNAVAVPVVEWIMSNIREANND